MSIDTPDVLISGGGPAGLAAAIAAALNGLSVVVLERGTFPVDKACGESMMPLGIRVLDRLGARRHLPPDTSTPYVGIRYLQEDGSIVEGKLPEPGFGIRRVALSTALLTRARELGVQVEERSVVEGFQWTAGEGVRVQTRAGERRAKVLVAADGLHSPLRRAAGLDVPHRRLRRFGMRQHFQIAPWTDHLEAHLSYPFEAYAAPCGSKRVGIGINWARGAPGTDRPLSFDTLLSHFPVLAERLRGVPVDSTPRGAGPLFQKASDTATNGLVLLGDAAGYVDAITGEGLSLALESAEILGNVLPDVVAHHGARAAFRPYVRAYRRLYREYAMSAEGLLLLMRVPWLRRAVVRFLARRPFIYQALLGHVVGRTEPLPGTAVKRLQPSTPSATG